MTDITDPRRAEDGQPPGRSGLFQRRREKIAAEVQRNRRGEFSVPTWVLVVILLALIGGWLAFVLTV